MKIKSNIDEIVCTTVQIAVGPTLNVSAEFGYLSGGRRCGHVEIVGIADPNVKECARKLTESLEEYFCGVVGEKEKVSRPEEPRGLIQQEF